MAMFNCYVSSPEGILQVDDILNINHLRFLRCTSKRLNKNASRSLRQAESNLQKNTQKPQLNQLIAQVIFRFAHFELWTHPVAKIPNNSKEWITNFMGPSSYPSMPICLGLVHLPGFYWSKFRFSRQLTHVCWWSFRANNPTPFLGGDTAMFWMSSLYWSVSPSAARNRMQIITFLEDAKASTPGSHGLIVEKKTAGTPVIRKMIFYDFQKRGMDLFPTSDEPTYMCLLVSKFGPPIASDGFKH